jgi:hypothetical protein
LGFIALCIVTVAMVTAPFSEKRRRDKSFLTSTWIFHAPQALHASDEAELQAPQVSEAEKENGPGARSSEAVI